MKKSSIGLWDTVVSEEGMPLHAGRLNAVPGCCTRVVYNRKRAPTKSVANSWSREIFLLIQETDISLSVHLQKKTKSSSINNDYTVHDNQGELPTSDFNMPKMSVSKAN